MTIKERVVVFPDIHFPNHDEKAFKCALNVIKAVKPTAFLLLGDAIDGESVSHWQWSKKKRPPLEYQLPAIKEEIKQGNKGLDRIDRALDKVGCKKKQFAQGNHEKWFDHFVEENPYLEHYGSRRAFKFDKRGYEWHKYGEVFKVFGSKLHASTEDTIWELPMQELTPYNWVVTSSTGIHTTLKNQQLPTSQEATWRIQWDV